MYVILPLNHWRHPVIFSLKQKKVLLTQKTLPYVTVMSPSRLQSRQSMYEIIVDLIKSLLVLKKTLSNCYLLFDKHKSFNSIKEILFFTLSPMSLK